MGHDPLTVWTDPNRSGVVALMSLLVAMSLPVLAQDAQDAPGRAISGYCAMLQAIQYDAAQRGWKPSRRR